MDEQSGGRMLKLHRLVVATCSCCIDCALVVCNIKATMRRDRGVPVFPFVVRFFVSVTSPVTDRLHPGREKNGKT